MSGISVGRTTSKVEIRSDATSSRRSSSSVVDVAHLAGRDAGSQACSGSSLTASFETGEDGVDVARVRAEVEDGVEVDARRDLVVGAAELAEVELLLPRAHRRALDEAVGVVAREAGLDERVEHALAEEEEVARLEVPAHPLGPHDEALDEPGEAVEHVVEREERVGDDDALGRGVRDVALVPERDVLEADERVRPDDAREPADPLGDDRVPLVRHRRRALLAAAERLLHLADLGAREVPDLERERVERGGDDRERRQQLGVAVALEDLRRGRRGLEPEPLAGEPLELGIGRGVGADGARELADAHPLERARDAARGRAPARTPSRRASARTSSARHGRRACGRSAASRGAPRPARRRPRRRGRGPARISAPACAHLQRERRVDDVGGGEAVVEPAALLAELLGDGVDEGGGVVVQRRLELGDPLRARRDGVRGDARRCVLAARLRARPRRPSRRARLRATRRASPRPTRSWPWPGASSGRSRLQSRGRSVGVGGLVPRTGDSDPREPRYSGADLSREICRKVLEEDLFVAVAAALVLARRRRRRRPGAARHEPGRRSGPAWPGPRGASAASSRARAYPSPAG